MSETFMLTGHGFEANASCPAETVNEELPVSSLTEPESVSVVAAEPPGRVKKNVVPAATVSVVSASVPSFTQSAFAIPRAFRE